MDDQPGDGWQGAGGPIVAFLRSLAEAPDGSTMGAALAEGLLATWAPDHVAVYVIDGAGDALLAVSHFGLDADQVRHYARVPLDVPVPITTVFRTGEEGRWRMDQAARDYPVVRGWTDQHPARATAEVHGLPIRRSGRIVGVLVVSFPVAVERTWRLRLLLDAAVSSIGVWVGSEVRPGPGLASRKAGGHGAPLTDRQLRVLALVREGRTNAAIATVEGVSLGTVKADLAHMFRVFGVRHRSELAAIADPAGPSVT
jgi:DNA-binding CsgD family transcriptional regulator